MSRKYSWTTWITIISSLSILLFLISIHYGNKCNMASELMVNEEPRERGTEKEERHKESIMHIFAHLIFISVCQPLLLYFTQHLNSIGATWWLDYGY